MKPGETKIFGTPFPKDLRFQDDLSGGQVKMDDVSNNLTENARTIPGLITGPNDSVGFNLNYLVPAPYANLRSAEHKARWDNPVLVLLPTDKIQVRYGPLIPDNANNTFGHHCQLERRESSGNPVFLCE